MKRVALLLALLLVPLLFSGCALDKFMGNFVNEHPVAVIDASPQEGPVDLTVSFDAGYSHDDGEIVQYWWDFGDPGDSTPAIGPSASHTYRHPGTYLVKLTVTDDEGAVNTQMIAVVATNPPPVAVFSVSNDYPCAGDTVEFDASASTDANGEIVSYEWDFGDGETGNGIGTSHAYTEDGYYVVTLTLTDDAGAIGTTTHAVTVQSGGGSCSGGTCGGGTSVDGPIAVISGLPSCAGIAIGETLTLDGSWSYSRVADGTILHYHWTFGDGESANGAVVTHAYARAGFFTVELTVTDDRGNRSTARGTVDVHADYTP